MSEKARRNKIWKLVDNSNLSLQSLNQLIYPANLKEVEAQIQIINLNLKNLEKSMNTLQSLKDQYIQIMRGNELDDRE